MVTETKQKPRQKEESASGTTALTPHRDFPVALGWMRDEFDRLFDRFTRNWPSVWGGHGWRWGVDMEDTDDAFIVRAEAPGFEASDFDIKVADGRLVLHAAKKVETKEKEGKAREYREQECHESVTLPASIDKDKVEAQYRNGILTVTLPKTAEGKARRIAVKTGCDDIPAQSAGA